MVSSGWDVASRVPNSLEASLSPINAIYSPPLCVNWHVLWPVGKAFVMSRYLSSTNQRAKNIVRKQSFPVLLWPSSLRHPPMYSKSLSFYDFLSFFFCYYFKNWRFYLTGTWYLGKLEFIFPSCSHSYGARNKPSLLSLWGESCLFTPSSALICRGTGGGPPTPHWVNAFLWGPGLCSVPRVQVPPKWMAHASRNLPSGNVSLLNSVRLGPHFNKLVCF